MNLAEMTTNALCALLEHPKQGSDEAIEMGCICPVLDNRHGLGAVIEGGVGYWTTEGCPLHNPVGEAREERRRMLAELADRARRGEF